MLRSPHLLVPGGYEGMTVTLFGTRCDSVSDLTLDYQHGSSVHHRDPCKREAEECRADTREEAMWRRGRDGGMWLQVEES